MIVRVNRWSGGVKINWIVRVRVEERWARETRPWLGVAGVKLDRVAGPCLQRISCEQASAPTR
jgi:hypothetical protein